MKKILLGILGFTIFFFFAFASGIYSAHVFDVRPSFQVFMVFTFIFGFFGSVLFLSYYWKKTGLGNFARSVRKKINMSDILLKRCLVFWAAFVFFYIIYRFSYDPVIYGKDFVSLITWIYTIPLGLLFFAILFKGIAKNK